MLGMHGARYTNRVIDECDLLIAIGCRFDDRATGRLDRFAPNAKLIHIDADRRELGKLRKPDLAIEAEAGAALHALIAAVQPQRRADQRVQRSEEQTYEPQSLMRNSYTGLCLKQKRKTK